MFRSDLHQAVLMKSGNFPGQTALLLRRAIRGSFTLASCLIT